MVELPPGGLHSDFASPLKDCIAISTARQAAAVDRTLNFTLEINVHIVHFLKLCS